MTIEEKRAYDAAYRPAYYEKNRDKMLAYGAAYRAAHGDAINGGRAELTEWLQILRTNNGCEDCGTREGRLLHHHIAPETKKSNVSEMYGFSLDALEDELEKCVVLCEPCHHKRHIEMRSA